MGDVININLQIREANDARDTIAKMLFKNLFTWIVQKVNISISNNFDAKKAQKSKFIGILDIFGFEIFTENSFE
jgi:myosin heavy subunit